MREAGGSRRSILEAVEVARPDFCAVPSRDSRSDHLEALRKQRTALAVP
jgi:hypothetical protein